MPKSRQDISELSAGQLSDYIHAVDILRARSAADPDDPAGYDFQAALHNDVFVGPCEHGSDLFLPWHRAHLHYFEKLLQGTDPPRTANVTVPYWDWIHAQPAGKFPAAFDLPGLSSPGRNLFPTPLPPDTLEIVTTETDPGAFGGYPEAHPGGDYGRLELGPHNYMHPEFIGGLMAEPGTAAQDPIYFSFHCFIDLLWAEWQRRNGSPPLSSPDHDLRGFLDQPRHKVADFHNTLDLDYAYAYTDQLHTAFGVPVPPPPPSRELMMTQPLEAVSEADFTTELREKARVQFRLTAPPDRGRRVVVRLDELKVPVTGSYTLRAFVHPADVEFRRDDEAFARSYGVGYVSMWRAHDASHGGGHGTPHGPHGGHGHHGGHGPPAHHPTAGTARFDVTAVLASATAAPGDHVLTLQYLPSPTPTGEAQEPAALVAEVALRDVLMEVYD